MENIDAQWTRRVASFKCSPNVAAPTEKYTAPTVYIVIYSNGGARHIKGVFKNHADAENLEYKLRMAISERSAYYRILQAIQQRKESIFIETHVVQSYYKRGNTIQ